MILQTEVAVLTWWWSTRDALVAKAREERGDAYSQTIMIAIGVTIAIIVGGILLVKFQGKAEDIDTNTPTGAPTGTPSG